VFALLDTPSKLRATAVCVSWRAPRRAPALWRRLELTAPFFSAAGAVAFVSGDARSPLPSGGCVAELELRGGPSHEARAYDALLAACGRATRVTLSGKRLTAQALALLAKPRGAPLQALTLGHLERGVWAENSALADVLAASPALTHLTCEQFLDDVWARALTPPAAGAPALRELHARMLSVHTLARLGAGAPRLASLTVGVLTATDMDDSASLAWAHLPCLRALRVLTTLYLPVACQQSSLSLQPLLACVATAAPGLRALHFSFAKQYVSAEELEQGEQYAPLQPVGAGGGGIFALRELEELTLENVHVCAADAEGACLPSLRRLALRNCGAHAAAAAAALAAAAPALTALALGAVPPVELGSGAPGPGVGGLSSLSHAALRSLSLVFFGDAPGDGGDALAAAAAACAAEVRALGARGALPALRSLELVGDATRAWLPLPPCFEAAHAWPALRALSLQFVTSRDTMRACLAGLRAPLLTSLSGPFLCSDAYEALRSSGHAPKLPPWRSLPPSRVEMAGALLRRRLSLPPLACDEIDEDEDVCAGR
jgi:hypothetical protein